MIKIQKLFLSVNHGGEIKMPGGYTINFWTDDGKFCVHTRTDYHQHRQYTTYQSKKGRPQANTVTHTYTSTGMDTHTHLTCTAGPCIFPSQQRHSINISLALFIGPNWPSTRIRSPGTMGLCTTLENEVTRPGPNNSHRAFPTRNDWGLPPSIGHTRVST